MKAKALIIGNSAYTGNILDNPVNDATDMAEVLTRLGFETTKALNVQASDQDKGHHRFCYKPRRLRNWCILLCWTWVSIKQ